MKKFLVSLVTLALSIQLFAISYTDKVTITLYDGTYYPNLLVGESPDIAPGQLENGYYAPIQDLANMPLAIYATFNAVNYENLILNSLKNIPIGIKTSAATSYSLYFNGIQGSKEVLILDQATEHVIHVNSESPYQFTIAESEKNGYLPNRFVLFYERAVDEGELDICHKDNQLQLLNNPYAENIVVKDANGDIVINEPSTNTPQYIDLSALASGQYTVELNNGNRSFIIKK